MSGLQHDVRVRELERLVRVFAKFFGSPVMCGECGCNTFLWPADHPADNGPNCPLCRPAGAANIVAWTYDPKLPGLLELQRALVSDALTAARAPNAGPR